MSWVQVLSAVQFGFAFFRKSRFRGFRSLRSEKIAKWIGIFPKKSRDEKTGDISRNLPFSLVFSCGSILTTQHGRGSKNRTHDTRFWRPLLYQLSYAPIQKRNLFGFAYVFWWAFRDSNPRPTGYEPVALTN